MTRMRPLLLAVLLATPSPGCSKRGHPSSSSASPPKTAAPSWREFSHAQGKFSVLMPGTPQEIVQDVPTAMGKLKQTVDVVELRDQAKAFAVMFADFPAKAPYGDEAYAHKKIDDILAGIASSRKSTVERKSRIKLGKHHGQECLLDRAESGTKGLWRVYLVGNRLFQLASDWSVQRGDTSADAEKFLNSFKLTE